MTANAPEQPRIPPPPAAAVSEVATLQVHFAARATTLGLGLFCRWWGPNMRAPTDWAAVPLDALAACSEEAPVWIGVPGRLGWGLELVRRAPEGQLHFRWRGPRIKRSDEYHRLDELTLMRARADRPYALIVPGIG